MGQVFHQKFRYATTEAHHRRGKPSIMHLVECWTALRTEAVEACGIVKATYIR
jgi:hypothetical protein